MLNTPQDLSIQDLFNFINSLHSDIQEVKTLLKPVPVQRWVSKKQAIQFRGCSLRTLNNDLKRGLYTVSRIGGRVMILRSDLEDHIKRCTIKKGHSVTPKLTPAE